MTFIANPTNPRNTSGGPFRRALTRIDWPQDTLIPPPGFGQMPEVDPVNAIRVGREFFSYVFKFSNLVQASQQQFLINTDKDGDFWLDTIYAIAYDHGTLTRTNRLARIAIMDTITGYQLFRPYMYLMNMTDPVGKTPQAGRAQGIMQPVCYQRGTVIQITASAPATGGSPPGQDIYGVLAGWKEYRDVSQ